MIINIRGTGGAGKSTIVRAVMGRYDTKAPAYVAGRRQPVGYLCGRSSGAPLWVVGHYETPCGGGDTITKPAEVFDRVREAAAAGYDVIFEGIISQDDVRRTIALKAAGYDLLVIALDVPMSVCLASIQARRDARHDSRPLDPRNTVRRAKSVEHSACRLAAAGVDVRRLSREAALGACMAALGIDDDGVSTGAGGGPAVAVRRQTARPEAGRSQTLFDALD